MNHLIRLVLLALLVSLPAQARATSAPVVPIIPETPAGAGLVWFLDSMNGTDPILVEGRFTAGFLKQVPAPNLRGMLEATRQQYGGFDLIEITPRSEHALSATIRPRKGDGDLQLIAMTDAEPPHAFTALMIRPAAVRAAPGDSWEKVQADLPSLGARTALAIDQVTTASGPRPVLRAGEEGPLAIGSAFKLWILLALSEAVHEGNAQWDEVFLLDDRLKSLPTGDLRLAKDASRITLAHYAVRMMAASDNTATDHLLDRLGRPAVESAMARFTAQSERNQPLLSTLEMFTLKLGDPAVRSAFLASDLAGRRALLDGLQHDRTALEAAVAGWTEPRDIDTLEWFASAGELTLTMAVLEELARVRGHLPVANALRLNPGLNIDREVWTTVSFKGGSEPGVMSLVLGLEHQNGNRFTLALVVNDPNRPLDTLAIVNFAQRAVALLGR